MTVASTISRVTFAGNGVTTLFAVSFPYRDQADLKVVETDDATGVEIVRIITTDYTVSPTINATSGTVTMVVAPAVGKTLTILRDPEITQGVDLVENDATPAETKEGALDKLTLICQRLDDLLSRAVLLSDGDTLVSMILPSLVTRKNKFFAFDSAGLPTPVDSTNTASLEAKFALANNTSVPADLVGLLFPSAANIGVQMRYVISIKTSTVQKVESGVAHFLFDQNAAAWVLVGRPTNGQNSGIIFSITAGGQIQYTSLNEGGTGYAGKLRVFVEAFSV